jgi:hypothetical protein
MGVGRKIACQSAPYKEIPKRDSATETKFYILKKKIHGIIFIIILRNPVENKILFADVGNRITVFNSPN